MYRIMRLSRGPFDDTDKCHGVELIVQLHLS